MFTEYTREEIAKTSIVKIQTVEKLNAANPAAGSEDFESKDYACDTSDGTAGLNEYDLEGESLW